MISAAQQRLPQTRFFELWINSRHLDGIVRTVIFAIAAANTAVCNEYLTVDRSVDNIRRAIQHAIGMLAMAA